MRVGIIRPVMNRECAAVITSTGSSGALPSSSGIRAGGNHRSHCAASPGAQISRSAGSGRRYCGRSRATFSRNHDERPVPADPLGDHRRRHLRELRQQRRAPAASNGENDVGTGLRSYFGGTADATARATVDLPIPS